ncbi:MAG: hypothetical protein OXT06_28935, partial [Rhodospirillaceae bacterium]|nr:hypothetical protein [Rhodospirillaceae bacterium]
MIQLAQMLAHCISRFRYCGQAASRRFLRRIPVNISGDKRIGIGKPADELSLVLFQLPGNLGNLALIDRYFLQQIFIGDTRIFQTCVSRCDLGVFDDGDYRRLRAPQK